MDSVTRVGESGGLLLLSTNEVGARAAEFAREWKEARCEAGEKQTFKHKFFRVFGMKRRQARPSKSR